MMTFVWGHIKNLIKTLRVNPILRAGSEALITIAFTFAPIAALSIPIIDSEDSLSNGAFLANFFSYWNSGEIVLPTLALCGGLIALNILNRTCLSDWFSGVSITSSIVIVIVVSAFLGRNQGFKDNLLPGIVLLLFFIYIATLALWFFVAFAVNKGAITRPSSDARADELIKEANKRKTKAQR